MPLTRDYSATEMAPAERRLLRQCVAYLRHVTLPATVLPALRRQAMAAQAGLRADIDGQWRQVLTLAGDSAHIVRLDGLRRLLDLHDDCTESAPYDAQLTELIRLVELSSLSNSTLLLQLRELAERTADGYSVEAGSSAHPGHGPPGERQRASP